MFSASGQHLQADISLGNNALILENLSHPRLQTYDEESQLHNQVKEFGLSIKLSIEFQYVLLSSSIIAHIDKSVAENDPPRADSVLNKLLKVNRNVAIVMALDLIMTGVDTVTLKCRHILRNPSRGLPLTDGLLGSDRNVLSGSASGQASKAPPRDPFHIAGEGFATDRFQDD